MCPPDHYGIEYEINPWMSRARGTTPERGRLQWHDLHDTLVKLGVRIEFERWQCSISREWPASGT